MILFELCRNCGGPVSPSKQAIGVCNACVSRSRREPLIPKGPRYGFQVAVNGANDTGPVEYLVYEDEEIE